MSFFVSFRLFGILCWVSSVSSNNLSLLPSIITKQLGFPSSRRVWASSCTKRFVKNNVIGYLIISGQSCRTIWLFFESSRVLGAWVANGHSMRYHHLVDALGNKTPAAFVSVGVQYPHAAWRVAALVLGRVRTTYPSAWGCIACSALKLNGIEGTPKPSCLEDGRKLTSCMGGGQQITCLCRDHIFFNTAQRV